MKSKATEISGHIVRIEVSEASQKGGQGRAWASHVLEQYFDGYRTFEITLPGNIGAFNRKSVGVLRELPSIKIHLYGEGASLIKKPKPVLVQITDYLKHDQNGRGWVYVATNPWLDETGHVKIGCTIRDPIVRLAEIKAAAALPYQFLLIDAFPVELCRDSESKVHAALCERRENGSEWFACDDIGPEEIAVQVGQILGVERVKPNL